MTDAPLLERYQQYRTRRFLAREQQLRGRLPRMRSRARRRALVVALSMIYLAMITIAVLTYWDVTGAYIGWAVATAAMLAGWTTLQVVTVRGGDAPRGALDERELAQRDSARSIGLTITQTAVFVPAAILIFVSSGGGGSNALAYMCGLLTLTAVLIGGTSPAMILAWSRPDDPPDEYFDPTETP